MKIRAIGKAIILNWIFVDVLNKVAKYEPEKLILKDEDKEAIFGVEFSKNGPGSISAHGVAFNDVAADGSVQLTIMVPTSVDDVQGWLVKNFTTAFARLEALEPQIEEAFTRCNEMEARITAAITVE